MQHCVQTAIAPSGELWSVAAEAGWLFTGGAAGEVLAWRLEQASTLTLALPLAVAVAVAVAVTLTLTGACSGGVACGGVPGGEHAGGGEEQGGEGQREAEQRACLGLG